MRKVAVIVSLLIIFILAAGAAWAQQEKAAFVLGDKTYVTDGQKRQMDVAPFIDKNGRTMVPVRYLAYALGVPEKMVFWRDSEQVVYLYGGDVGVFLVVGDPETLVVRGIDAALLARLFYLEDLVNEDGKDAAQSAVEQALEEFPELETVIKMSGEEFGAWFGERVKAVEMDTVPLIEQGRVFLPARYVAEAFGYTVYWNQSAQRVSIKPLS